MKNRFYNAILVSTLVTSLVSCGGSKTIAVKTIYSSSSPQVSASATELTRITDDFVPEFQPQISPDGLKMIYAIRDDAKTVNQFSIRLKTDILAPGFNPLIDKSDSPSWIDDEEFLFSYQASKRIIARSKINQLGIKYLGQGNYGDFDTSPQMISNKAKVVINTKISGEHNIALLNPDGSGLTIIEKGSYPKWHPSKNVLLFYALSGDKYQLFELNLDTNQKTQITSGTSNSFEGNYSPNGEYITFISDRDNEREHVFIMDRNGQSITQLTSGDSDETHPFWGSDNFIYFSSNAGAKKPDGAEQTTKWKYADIWRAKPIL
ncbi:MAG: hypothetical protein GYB39_11315 [Algicola sp.]|nr:hypothetical protein [Algicola sp.]